MHEQGSRIPAMVSLFLLTTAILVMARSFSPLQVFLADRFNPGTGWLQIIIMGGYASWVGSLLLKQTRRASLIRSRIWGLFSLVFFAQLVFGLAGAELLLMTGDLHIPVPALIADGPVYRGGEGLFMPVLYGISLLLVGPAWCSWLCYIGAWDDKLSRLKKPAATTIPRWATLGLRTGILLLVLVAAFILGYSGVPWQAAAVLAIGFGLAGIAVMLFLSAGTGHMVHCTVFCPIGLLSNTLGRLNPFRIRIAPGCTSCGACAQVCRYSALNQEDIRKGKPGLTCTLCGDCVNICPESVLGYRFLHFSPQTARTLFIILVVSLHVVFLSTARI